MSYIQKIISPNEKLIGVARLHWIYILQGVLWFVICLGFAHLINKGIYYMIAGLSAKMNHDYSALVKLTYITPLFTIAGIFIFLTYLAKVMTTEIGLSTSRVIRKEGFLFVRVHDVSIEEIQAEMLDLGWFGRILGYGFIKLDCRLVGDVQTPAIENPERFLRALQQVRSQITDTLMGIKKEMPSREQVAEEQRTFGTETSPQEKADQVNPNIPPKPAHPSQHQTQPQQQPIVVHVAPPAAATVDPNVVAQVIEQAMPQIVEKVAEEIASKGIIVPGQPANESPEEELLSSFKESAVH